MLKQRITIIISLILLAMALYSQERIDEMPVFRGNFASFIAQNIEYPNSAKADSLTGTVYVSFTVNKDGSTTQHKIIRGIREDLDNEALRISKLIKFEKPATVNREPIVLYQDLISVRFTLSNQIDVGERRIHPMLYYAQEDSCFCIKNSVTYDNPDVMELFGVPEEDITGKYYPLMRIIQNTKYSLLQGNAGSDFFDELFVMRIVVDKEGKVRCGVLLKGNHDIYAKRMFELLKNEDYLPAKIRGKSIVWHYYFTVRM